MQEQAFQQQAFTDHNASSTSPFLIICDHARNDIPAEYHDLGLEKEQLTTHIAYDLGAAALAQEMAVQLDCRAILSSFSRLLIDPNRGVDDPTLVMKLSDGHVIPGNRSVDWYHDRAEMQRRIDHFYTPYHNAIAAAVDGISAQGLVPIIVSMHSFTPFWKNEMRPWHGGVLWDSDRRLADYLMAHFAQDPAICFGDNEPYSGRLKNDTMYRQATSKGLPHALIEVRQDITTDPVQRQAWAARLSGILQDAANDPLLQKKIFTPSSTG